MIIINNKKLKYKLQIQFSIFFEAEPHIKTLLYIYIWHSIFGSFGSWLEFKMKFTGWVCKWTYQNDSDNEIQDEIILWSDFNHDHNLTCENEEDSDCQVHRGRQLGEEHRVDGRGDKPGAPLRTILSHGCTDPRQHTERRGRSWSLKEPTKANKWKN